MNIYELTNDMLDIMQMLEDPELDVDEQTLFDTFEAVQGNYDDKINGYCKMINNCKYTIEALEAEKKRIYDRIKKYESIQVKLKSTITKSLQDIGKKKYRTDLFNINRLTNTKLIETGAIPDEFKKTVERKEKDTATIRKALDNGEKLGFAKYVKSCTIQ